MGFPNHRLRKRHVRRVIVVPAVRIGAAEVHDHAAPAIHAGPARPRIGDAVHGTAIAFNQKVVIHAVLVVGEIVRPEPSDSGRIVYCPIRASPLSPMEPRENSLRVTFCAEGAQRANWVPD